MSGHPELGNRIRQMREGSDSVEVIVSTLDVPWELVRRVVREFETEAVLSSRSSRFMETIRRADDPDKKWKVGYLVQALRQKVITQNAITHHFEWAKQSEVSLRELMDLAVSPKEHPKPGYLITPLLDFRCVGLRGFWSAVRQLTESDLGERCNEEWRKRLIRLRHALRIVGGGRCSWSTRCEPPPWLLNSSPPKAKVGSTSCNDDRQ